jgi:hypothetical protein
MVVLISIEQVALVPELQWQPAHNQEEVKEVTVIGRRVLSFLRN